ncbi:hypothetical protein GYMLUDRAFT_253020 [Collybiopsis luxurians FD-317 M1]|uniref:Uncharacterized protein n=1 Tax=Collybiopsis luxurians FD-317 M1 TaxID=944289 RepID=A0A0D0C6R7_9AGAR|nr:hypothetical protein GYMLUDRAFT_253020 [Collybiopsis luxurians FD-317 M1]
MMDSDTRQRRSSCKTSLPLSSFPRKLSGYLKTCSYCATKKRTKYTPTQEQQGSISEGDLSPEEPDDTSGLDEIPLELFLDQISRIHDLKTISALINVTDLKRKYSGDSKSVPDALSKLIWEEGLYRFIYHSKRDHKNTPTACFIYNCAQMMQRQHKLKKSSRKDLSEDHQRDKLSMYTHDCKGWLNITVVDGDGPEAEVAFVSLKLIEDHEPYCNLEVPEDVKKFVLENAHISNVTQRRRPKYYDVSEAHTEFDFIDKTFVPKYQIQEGSTVNTSPLEVALPHLRVRFNNEWVFTAPPRLTIRINGALHAAYQTRKRDREAAEGGNITEEIGDNEANDLLVGEEEKNGEDPNSKGEDEVAGEVEDVIRKYPDTDQEDAPDFMFEEGECNGSLYITTSILSMLAFYRTD